MFYDMFYNISTCLWDNNGLSPYTMYTSENKILFCSVPYQTGRIFSVVTRFWCVFADIC